jgi:predicted nucleic-acid-binding Zn-ribbon protein
MAQLVNATVNVAGKPLACVVCGNGRFAYREVKLNTTGLTFFDLDWLNRSGVGAICTACGYLHTFVDADLLAWSEG